jgi:hypothetical protein
MSAPFASRWLDWKPETPVQTTDKTDRKGSGPRVSGTPRQGTDKTAKSLMGGELPESLDAEHRFGQPHARLFPFLEKRVETPLGPGTLRAVHYPTAWVHLDGAERLTKIPWEEVEP